jgi:hypothetical protein
MRVKASFVCVFLHALQVNHSSEAYIATFMT